MAVKVLVNQFFQGRRMKRLCRVHLAEINIGKTYKAAAATSPSLKNKTRKRISTAAAGPSPRPMAIPTIPKEDTASRKSIQWIMVSTREERGD